MRASSSERVTAMHERWDEILVQKYVDGREVNVGVLGDQALPVAEILFDGMPRGMWRIVSYKSKWETGCDEDLGSVPQCPAKMPKEQSEELKRIALKAWRLAGGEGYGRVDLRIDRAGKPWILEVEFESRYLTRRRLGAHGARGRSRVCRHDPCRVRERAQAPHAVDRGAVAGARKC